jgi:hypothetical protein
MTPYLALAGFVGVLVALALVIRWRGRPRHPEDYEA